MSGGHFDYQQHTMVDIADSIQSFIDTYEHDCSLEVLTKLREGVELLHRAYVFAHRIDWFISGDDGDKTFLKRLSAELAKLDSTTSNKTTEVDGLFEKINKFDDALWVKNYGNNQVRVAETLSDLGQDDVEDILTGYWKLMNALLNK